MDDKLKEIGVLCKVNGTEHIYHGMDDKAIARIKDLFLEMIGEEDNSPMYFAELFKGQSRNAHNIRKGRNDYITELRKKVKGL